MRLMSLLVTNLKAELKTNENFFELVTFCQHHLKEAVSMKTRQTFKRCISSTTANDINSVVFLEEKFTFLII